MRFGTDFDEGHKIKGFMLPDNPTKTPKIQIRLDDGSVVEMTANDHRQDLIDMGLHSTGYIGFYIDESSIPSLREQKGIEIWDNDDNILIYRRSDPRVHIEKKIILFDASISSKTEFFNTVSAHFAMNYDSVEQYTFDTMVGLIYIWGAVSQFMMGRPSYMRHSGLLKQREFITVALLDNPFEEMAKRLMFLKLLSKPNNSIVLERNAKGLLPMVEFARDFPFEDHRAMKKYFAGASHDFKRFFQDPMTQMLACEVDEKPTWRHVTMALGNLAAMDVVGTRQHFSDFKVILADVVGANILGNCTPISLPSVKIISERLEKISAVTKLLENDLALYSYAAEAVEANAMPKP